MKLEMNKQSSKRIAQVPANKTLSAREEYVVSEPAELTESELASTIGGMKWNKNYRSPNVIDARGGSFEVCGVQFTMNVKGTISSINGKGTLPPS
jgi:hypothetical protein